MSRSLGSAVVLVTVFLMASQGAAPAQQADQAQPGVKWSEAQIREAVAPVRVGRRLTPKTWPDGNRVAALAEKAQPDVVNDKVVLLFNFFDELKRVLPVKQ